MITSALWCIVIHTENKQQDSLLRWQRAHPWTRWEAMRTVLFISFFFFFALSSFVFPVGDRVHTPFPMQPHQLTENAVLKRQLKSMPQDERNARYLLREQQKKGNSDMGDALESDAYVKVQMSGARTPRKSVTPLSRAGFGIREEAFKAGSLESLSTAPTAPTAGMAGKSWLLSLLFSCSAYVVQAFHYTLSEGGMALMTAFVLFLLSFVGVVTVHFIAPNHTSSIVSQLSTTFMGAADEMQRPLPDIVLPEALTLLQTGLQVMVIPALLISFCGVFVLSSADRRRPGCWLVTYGSTAFIFGLVLLYLLLRVIFSGSLSGLEEKLNSTLYQMWLRQDGDPGPCSWESVFPCSGFHLCCVTNTTPLVNDSDWDSICFMTQEDGTAVTRDDTDVTSIVHEQCGELKMPKDKEENEEGGEENTKAHEPMTACAAASAKTETKSSTEELETCENYVLGHLTSTVGFALCLMLGMSVCSLVSGVVSIISSLQRPRWPGFMEVNNPAVVVDESAMTVKSKH